MKSLLTLLPKNLGKGSSIIQSFFDAKIYSNKSLASFKTNRFLPCLLLILGMIVCHEANAQYNDAMSSLKELEAELAKNKSSKSSKVNPNDPCGGKGYTLCQVCNGSGSLMSGNYLTGYFTTSCYYCFGSGKFECPFCKGKKDMETMLDNLNRMTPEEQENYLRMQQIQLQQNQQFINSIHQNNEEYRQEIREIDRRTNERIRKINSSCPSCYGTGNCNMCHGSGVVSNLYTSGNHKCSACWSGHPGKCSRCKGSGRQY